MPNERFVFNGVDATTGAYLFPPLSSEEVARLAQPAEPAHLDELRWWRARTAEATFGPAEGVDPRDLSDAGWGVVVAAGTDEAVLEALQPLLDLRREQATRRSERRFRSFTGSLAYRPGETKQEFLARNGAGPGPADPDRMPYYLLLVGDPEALPYRLQYQLDVQYAVGRLCFERAEDYARYAAAVVGAETQPRAAANAATFFGPANLGDRATALSSAELVSPLAARLADDHPDWSVRGVVGDAATKSALLETLGGPATPSVLFTATHGAGFPPGHPAQRGQQGALVCQEWQGPDNGIDEKAYVAADDIPADAALGGLIAFHFACFGAGTPAFDDYAQRDTAPRRRLAPTAFVAALPQRLLAHERGGALAVVGHVERAWGYSFTWPGAGRQTEVYRSTLERLLAGHPIGSAFEYFNERYAELASDLSVALEDLSYGKRPDHGALATMWTANNDARAFAILGDPAVRLPVTGEPSPERHERAVVTVTPPREQPPTPLPADTDVDFGLIDSMREARQRLGASVQHLAQTLADVLERAAESVAVVEVATYTSDDPATAAYDPVTRGFEGSRLRALSRASITGDIQLLVPEGDGLDAELWPLHVAMVEQAQRTRAELLRSAGAAVTGLFDALRPGS